ncbi:MAG: dihydroneopterin aldolase [Nitrososphaeria archaeon]
MVSRVGVRGLKVKCRVGIDRGEDMFERIIEVDFELELARDYMGGIESTVSYSEASRRLREAIEGKRFELIEDVALEAARALKSFPGVKRIKVRVTKPSLPDGALMSYFVYEKEMQGRAD